LLKAFLNVFIGLVFVVFDLPLVVLEQLVFVYSVVPLGLERKHQELSAFEKEIKKEGLE
jgi:flagellar biosynthesis protein FliR